MPLTNLLLTGGINHDYADNASAMADVLEEGGIISTIFEDIDEGFDTLAAQPFDLVTVLALRWRMLDDVKYLPHREQWAYEIAERDRNNLQQHVHRGGGLLGLHTAAICFDTWKDWPGLLGARWVWGQTFHPPPEEILIEAVGQHPIINGLPSFKIEDEIYYHIEAQPEATPLLQTSSGDYPGLTTLSWCQSIALGRTVYHAPGHDRASISAPGHARFLQRAARWCCGVES